MCPYERANGRRSGHCFLIVQGVYDALDRTQIRPVVQWVPSVLLDWDTQLFSRLETREVYSIESKSRNNSAYTHLKEEVSVMLRGQAFQETPQGGGETIVRLVATCPLEDVISSGNGADKKHYLREYHRRLPGKVSEVSKRGRHAGESCIPFGSVCILRIYYIPISGLSPLVGSAHDSQRNRTGQARM